MQIDLKPITISSFILLIIYASVYWFNDGRTPVSGYVLLLQFIPLISGMIAYQSAPGLKPFFERLGNFVNQRFVMFSVLLFAVAFSILVFVNQIVIQRFFNSGDEFSCYFFVQYLLEGRFWVDPHPLHEFFQVAHVGVKNEKWFSVFPPGWPLVWAAATAAGAKHLIGPFLASGALVFWAIIFKQLYRSSIALLAVLLVLVSPFYLATGASYYSHSLSLFLISLFIYSWFRWEKTGQWYFAVLSALAIGFELGTRYLTGAAMALPFVVRYFYIFFTKKGWTKKTVWAYALIVFALLFLHAFYNFKITGSFFDAPNHFLRSHEKLGFTGEYSPFTALNYLQARVFYLMEWSAPLLVVLAICGFLLPSASLGESLVKLSAISLVVAYMFYYSWGGHQHGPRYYYEAYPIFCAVGINSLWIFLRGESKGLVRAAIVGMMILLSLNLTFRHLSTIGEYTSERKAAYDLIYEEAERPALVFLKGPFGDKLILSQDDIVRNTPLLSAPIILAHDKGDKNHELASYFPERNIYDVSYDRKLNQAKIKRIRPQ